MRIAVYLRVSTDRQSTESQKKEIKDWLKLTHPGSRPKWFIDEAYSGKNLDRPAFIEMKKAIDQKKIDLLVVSRLDRIARSANQAIKLIMELDEAGIQFTSINEPMFNTDNEFRIIIVAICAVFAQLERKTTIARIKASLAAKKAKGQRLGQKPFDKKKVDKILALKASGTSISGIAKTMKISRQSVYKYLDLGGPMDTSQAEKT